MCTKVLTADVDHSIIGIETDFMNYYTKLFLTFTLIILWVEINGKVMRHLETGKRET